jgi:hypothetical protein
VVTVTITAGWVIALIVMVSVRGLLPAEVRWWVWTCACGTLMGVFGLWYVPLLKRRRARQAAQRTRAARTATDGSPTAGTAGDPSGSPAAGAADGPQLSSGYVSRDSDSNAVSPTETPGKSTRS